MTQTHLDLHTIFTQIFSIQIWNWTLDKMRMQIIRVWERGRERVDWSSVFAFLCLHSPIVSDINAPNNELLCVLSPYICILYMCAFLHIVCDCNCCFYSTLFLALTHSYAHIHILSLSNRDVACLFLFHRRHDDLGEVTVSDGASIKYNNKITLNSFFVLSVLCHLNKQTYT